MEIKFLGTSTIDDILEVRSVFVGIKGPRLKIDQEILTLCRSGGRSQVAAVLLSGDGYNCINISDGFEGSDEGVGWMNSDLPVKF